MPIPKELLTRAASQCELCTSPDQLDIYKVATPSKEEDGEPIVVCQQCQTQLQNPTDLNHWRCLNESIWSTVPAVQVAAWRVLYALRAEGWPQDLLDIMYTDEETLAWAKSGVSDEPSLKHIDSNGVELSAGDHVVLTKDLNVKGTSLVAKRGTALRGISLDHTNAEYIEGKVNGQQIMILTKFVKKM